jgi:hypothetical protein
MQKSGASNMVEVIVFSLKNGLIKFWMVSILLVQNIRLPLWPFWGYSESILKYRLLCPCLHKWGPWLKKATSLIQHPVRFHLKLIIAHFSSQVSSRLPAIQRISRPDFIWISFGVHSMFIRSSFEVRSNRYVQTSNKHRTNIERTSNEPRIW